MFGDTDEIREDVKKLLALHVRTLQLLALTQAELQLHRGILLGIQVNLGAEKEQAIRAASEKFGRDHKARSEGVLGMIEEIMGAPPPDDPWWDKPEGS